jgi:toxin ParE1/3/4
LSGGVTRSREADKDLTEIWVHIAVDNPAAADRLIYAIVEAEQRLARFASVGRMREGFNDGGVRSWVVESYLIFYRPDVDGIHVIRVLHGSRDIDHLIGDP